tara:strand:- start:549 stop:1613 length:1065 start_codon:yes stop_codon:yes gene_type:complete
MISIGINGLGRIGKSILHQAIERNKYNINAINIPDFNKETLMSYLKHDSCHKYNTNNYSYNNEEFYINNKKVHLYDSRDPKKIDWNKKNVEYLVDTTGVFLTKEKAELHKVNKFIMCAPAKDDTKQFVFNGNHNDYNNENIISNASCTTNCLVPVLKLLNDEYGIIKSNFITVHAATASQNVIDSVHLKNRTHRSIFNNIIPHSTGASKSVVKILPSLKEKIHGTSVRIPTANVSMIDLNVILNKSTNLSNIMNFLESKSEVNVNKDKHLVSSDFMTSECPSIVDKYSSMEMGDNHFKITIWYDNEWSYCAQVLNMIEYMETYKETPKHMDVDLSCTSRYIYKKKNYHPDNYNI